MALTAQCLRRGVALAAAALYGCATPTTQTAQPKAQDYTVEEWVPGSSMHGVHGLAFGPDGLLYGASLTGYSVYRIDPATGAVSTAVGPPQGNADDVAFGPGGLMVWTAGAFGSVYAALPGGEVRTLARDLPGVNSVNFSPDGRLFLTRVFAGDALYELDPQGVKAPRLIRDKLGGLNGFEVTAEGKLYGPLFFKRKVVQIDVNTGAMTDIADGFKVPAAVNLDARGNLYVVDIESGEVTRIGLATRERQVIATLEPPLDNLAIDKRGWLFVSNPAANRITEIDPETGRTRIVVSGSMSSPGGLATGRMGAREGVFIADFWGNRFVAAETGALNAWRRPAGVPSSGAVAVAGDRFALSSIWPVGAVFIADLNTNKTLRTVALGAPYGMAFLADGSLVVADYKGNQLVRLSSADSREKSVVATGLDGPVGVAAAGDALYVSEYGAGTIARIAPGDGARSVIAAGFDKPEGIAVDRDGWIIVAETGRERLVRVNPADGEREVLATGIPMGLAGGPDLPPPFLFSGVATDADGTIYASSDRRNAVYRLRPR
jgi:sugar lactone lactonase YvrE